MFAVDVSDFRANSSAICVKLIWALVLLLVRAIAGGIVGCIRSSWLAFLLWQATDPVNEGTNFVKTIH